MRSMFVALFVMETILMYVVCDDESQFHTPWVMFSSTVLTLGKMFTG